MYSAKFSYEDQISDLIEECIDYSQKNRRLREETSVHKEERNNIYSLLKKVKRPYTPTERKIVALLEIRQNGIQQEKNR